MQTFLQKRQVSQSLNAKYPSRQINNVLLVRRTQRFDRLLGTDQRYLKMDAPDKEEINFQKLMSNKMNDIKDKHYKMTDKLIE